MKQHEPIEELDEKGSRLRLRERPSETSIFKGLPCAEGAHNEPTGAICALSPVSNWVQLRMYDLTETEGLLLRLFPPARPAERPELLKNSQLPRLIDRTPAARAERLKERPLT